MIGWIKSPFLLAFEPLCSQGFHCSNNEGNSCFVAGLEGKCFAGVFTCGSHNMHREDSGCKDYSCTRACDVYCPSGYNCPQPYDCPGNAICLGWATVCSCDPYSGNSCGSYDTSPDPCGPYQPCEPHG